MGRKADLSQICIAEKSDSLQWKKLGDLWPKLVSPIGWEVMVGR